MKLLRGMLVVPFALLLATDLVAQDQEVPQRTVTGSVVDDVTGQRVDFPQIEILGTSIGTVGAEDGTFSLQDVPRRELTLRVSRIGYKRQEFILAAGRDTIRVRLGSDILRIEELVVSGRVTTVQRRNLANAVSVVDGVELNEVPIATIEAALVGKVTGAIVEQNSGAPGGGVQLTLRGVSSINASSDPLYVVDGVITSNVAISNNQEVVTRSNEGSNPDPNQQNQVNRIADFNPEDIESVTVLKGPSAAAIYGAKASNGVVLIRTKRGQPGPPRFDFTGRLGMFDLSNTIGSRVFTSADEAEAAFGAAGRTAFERGKTFDNEAILGGENDASWEGRLSVAGGDRNTSYYASAMAENQRGVIRNTGFKRQALRVNLQQNVGTTLNLGVYTNLTHTQTSRGITNNDNALVSYWMALAFTPSFQNLRPNADGVYPFNPFTGSGSNPLQTAALVEDDQDVWRLTASTDFDWNFARAGRHDLHLTGLAGVDFLSQSNSLFFPAELHFEATSPEPGTSLLNDGRNTNVNTGVSIVDNFTPASGAFTSTTSIGFQYESTDLEVNRIVSSNLVAGQANVDAGTSVGVEERREKVRDLGFFLQEELLLLQERLLLSAGVRADQSSNNGDTEKLFWYPKAAVSYRIPFGVGWLNELKLRSAFGQTGNRPLYGQKFTPLSSGERIAGEPGVVIQGTLGDPGIEPERMSEIEGGFDARLFNDAIGFEATFFYQKVTNLILERTPAPSSGFAREFFNGGSFRNQGIELTVVGSPVRNPVFGWFTAVRFFKNSTKITNLPVPAFEFGAFGSDLGTFKIEQGKSATQIVGNNGLDPGGQPIIEQLGDANPDFVMSFTNELNYKGFRLYTLLDWRVGQDLVNLQQLLWDLGQTSPDWVSPGPVREVPDCNPDCSGEERISGLGDYTQQYVQSGSFLRASEISVSYDLPSQVLGLNLRFLQLNLAFRNLFTITSYAGLDPLVSNFGNKPIGRSVDVAAFPPSRAIWFSVLMGI